MIFERSLSAQTAYAQLFEACQAAEALRSVSNLPDSFATKTVRGRKYWYFQYTEPVGKLRQVYVGPDSPLVQDLIAKKVVPASREAIGRLAKSATVLGCEEVRPKHYRVIERLADYGFFRAGGVLIGTHALIAYGNLMGVRWDNPERAQEKGFAHIGQNLSIALPNTLSLGTDGTVQSLSLGLLPIAGLSDKNGTTYLNPSDSEFKLNFITAMQGEAVATNQLPGITLQPLRFTEYLLGSVQEAVIFYGGKAVIVNIPAPAHYALHKLLIYGEYQGPFQPDIEQGLQQAASLLSLLKERFPWEIEDAWLGLAAHGSDWERCAKQGLVQLGQRYPGVFASEMPLTPN